MPHVHLRYTEYSVVFQDRQRSRVRAFACGGPFMRLVGVLAAVMLPSSAGHGSISPSTIDPPGERLLPGNTVFSGAHRSPRLVPANDFQIPAGPRPMDVPELISTWRQVLDVPGV